MQELRIAFRSLLRSPGFLVTAVSSLALAIGAAVAAFSVVDAVRLRGLPFHDADRLIVIGEVAAKTNSGAAPQPCSGACTVSYATYADVLRRTALKSIDQIVAYTSGGKALMRDGDAISVVGGVMSPNAFAMLDAKAIHGRPLIADDDRLDVPLVAVLSHSLWQSQFGADPKVVGTDVKLSDSHYTIVGVMEAGFDFESGADFWLPVVPTLDPSTKPSITSVTLFAHLAPGFSVAQARAELAALDLPTGANGAAAGKLVVDPLRERYAGAVQSRDLAFAAIVACVLLIACANLANLVLIRAMRQQREFAIRAALGGGGRALIRPVVLQNAIIVGLATAIGLSLAASSLGLLRAAPALNGLRPTALAYQIDGRAIGFALLVAVVAGAMISVIPIRLAARGDAQQLLRGAAGASRRKWARGAFAVAQVACATVLLTGAALMARTVMQLAQVNPGFDVDHLVTATPSYPHTWRQKELFVPATQRILDDVRQIPGVQSAAVRAVVQHGSRNGLAKFLLEGSAEPLATQQAPNSAQAITPGYFATTGVKLLAGRDFSENDAEQTQPVAIVNQWAASKWWPGQDPIGRTLRIEGAGAPVSVSVVGVIADNKATRPNLLLAQDGPELYRPYAQAPTAFPVFLARASGRADALIAPLRQTVARNVPDRPLGSAIARQNVDRQFAGVRQNALEIAGFAGVGLLLALIGVYGVMSFDVSRRTRELGIRGALGASRTGITTLVLRDASVLIAIGIAIGVGGAIAATRLIRSLLFQTSPTEPTAFVAVAICIAAVSLLAALIPARRAARVDPIVALRSE